MRSGKSGQTLVETVTAVAIATVILFAIYGTMTSSHGSWQTTQTRADVTRQLRSGLDRLGAELMNGGNVAITSGPPNDILTFQIPLAVTDSGTTWGAEGQVDWRIRYQVDSQGSLWREVLDVSSAIQGTPRVLARRIGPAGSFQEGFSATVSGTRVILVLVGSNDSASHPISGDVRSEIFLRNEDP